MGRFRSKRKRRSTWFPGLGQSNQGENVLVPWTEYSHYTGSVGFAAGTTNSWDAEFVGLTWDYPAEVEFAASNQIPSLADWQGSAWQLDGIKGACRARLNISPVDSTVESRLFTVAVAAFFEVLRVNEADGAPLDVDLEQYSTFNNENRRDPYIWQRSWLLGRDLQLVGPGTSGQFTFPNGFPPSNVWYEGRDTGSCIDAKSRRYIGTEERLFFCIECVLLGDDLTPAAREQGSSYNVDVEYDLDIRLLGRLRRATNRRNASR